MCQKNHRQHIAKAGFALIFASLCLSLVTFILSLPISFFAIGIWPQSEAVIPAIHALAVFICAGLILAYIRYPRLVAKSIISPPVLLLGSLGLLSLILLPFTEIPLRSFLGSARTGEGALIWLDLAIMTAGFGFIKNAKPAFKYMLLLALAVITGCFVLEIASLKFQTGFAPYFFPDYLSFLLICAIPIIYRLLNDKYEAILRWGEKFTPFTPVLAAIIIYALFVTFMMLTDNKAMIGYALLFPLLLKAHQKYAPSIKPLRNLEAPILAAMPILILLVLLGIAFYPVSDGFYSYRTSGITNVFNTIASRAFLLAAVFEPLLDEPWRFLTGLGWGGFEDHMARYFPANWVDFSNTLQIGQWDGLYTDHFHSHNIFLEVLAATGLVGLSLFISYIVSIYYFSENRQKAISLMFTSGLIIWCSFWFFVPLHYPFLALSSVLFINGRKNWIHSKCLHISNKFLIATLFLILALCGIGSYLSLTIAARLSPYEPIATTIENAKNSCKVTYGDYGVGGLHLSLIMVDRIRFIVRRHEFDLKFEEDTKKALAEGKEPPRPHGLDPLDIPAHILDINHLFCQTGQYAQMHKPGVRLELSRLIARGEILVSLSKFMDPETIAYYEQGWDSELQTWLQKYPKRSDQAVLFLQYSLITGREAESVQIIDIIIENNKNDPIGLWFKGLAMLAQPEGTQQGLSLMKRAYDGGIERFIPVEQDVRDLFKN